MSRSPHLLLLDDSFRCFWFMSNRIPLNPKSFVLSFSFFVPSPPTPLLPFILHVPAVQQVMLGEYRDDIGVI